jgi:SAM-dependent methyltransferase
MEHFLFVLAHVSVTWVQVLSGGSFPYTEYMTTYSAFAKYYDEAMGDMSWKIDFLKQLLKENAPAARSVLELACGTGTMLKGLEPEYSVAGADLSAEMVEIAQKKLPDADIQVGDMTSYDFGKTFDVVLCVYDSINHLMDWEQWQALFTNAERHLANGGIFIFDFNTTERLKWLADNPPFGREIGDDYMFMKIRDKTDHFDWDIRVFEKQPDERFILHKDPVQEVSFPVEEVMDEAAKHFLIEKVVDTKNFERNNPNWRPFIVCRKK